MSSNPIIERLNDAITEFLVDPNTQLVSGDATFMDLLCIARQLGELPTPDFKDRLRSSLERNIAMTQTSAVQFRPGFRTVTPYLLPPNEDFLGFLKDVFGAVEMHRTETSPASFHAELRIGDSMLMVGAGSGRTNPTFLSVFVPDVDAVYRRAMNAGCIELEAVRDDYGDRFGCVQDRAGNQWCITTHQGGSHIKENFNTLTVGFCVSGASRFLDFIKKAVSAEELERQEWPGGLYAAMRIGNSTVTVSESTNHPWMRPLPTMIYMYVPDADAAYERAIQAGAKAICPVADQPYGDRTRGVQDEWGNQWFMATPL